MSVCLCAAFALVFAVPNVCLCVCVSVCVACMCQGPRGCHRGIRLDSNFVHDCATGIFVDDAQVSITGNRLVANEKYDLWLCNAPGATHADNCAEKETEID